MRPVRFHELPWPYHMALCVTVALFVTAIFAPQASVTDVFVAGVGMGIVLSLWPTTPDTQTKEE